MSTQTPPSPAPPFDERTFGSWRKILLLAGPLILSHMGLMLMQIVDGLFASRYSTDAIAAIGPAGMSSWLLAGFFLGIAGFTSTFVAQYVGAGRPERVGLALWQGIYIALIAGGIMAAASLLAKPFFALWDHAPAIQANEVAYFSIMCYGGTIGLLSSALSGFFAGRNDNLPLMAAHLTGNVVNGVLTWAMVFGRLGLPEMGLAGAGWATVIGQATQVIILGAMVFRPRHQRQFHTWKDRRLDLALFWRMCRYGFPNGARMIVEVLAWDVFMLLMGKVDEHALAATNIVFRINTMAFMPVVGLATAVAMLVGQAQGAGRPDLSRKVTRRGLVIGEIWMVAAAALMVIAPNLLLDPFFGNGQSTQVQQLCVRLLWFVAIYCVMDNVNILLMSMLQGVGDTRWLMIVSASIHLLFLLIMLGIVGLGGGLYTLWTAATCFVCIISLAWILRYRSTRWESKRVIEQAPLDFSDIPATGAGA